MSAGDWIEHDGSGPPAALAPGMSVDAEFERRRGLIVLKVGVGLPLNWPGWWWRWRNVRVGWFRSEVRRLCEGPFQDAPRYAPIVRYRLIRPPALERLREIAANPPARILEDA